MENAIINNVIERIKEIFIAFMIVIETVITVAAFIFVFGMFLYVAITGVLWWKAILQ